MSVEELRETIDRLRVEVTELRASCVRLVLAADADREEIERDLHKGVQQHLVALAVNLQRADALAGSDPAAASTLLGEMGRDVQKALDDAAALATQISVTQLEVGGLAVALRSAAVSAGGPASVDVRAGSSYPPEVARTVCRCWLEALAHGGGETPVTVTVREEAGALTFELAATLPDQRLERLRDRVEALGGRLVTTEPGRFSGSLPLLR